MIKIKEYRNVGAKIKTKARIKIKNKFLVTYSLYGFKKDLGTFDNYDKAVKEVLKTYHFVKLADDVKFEIYDSTNKISTEFIIDGTKKLIKYKI